MKYFYLLLLSCIIPAAAFSQTNFKQGYIIKATGDTLRGYIDNREWNQNPEVVTFKANLADKDATHYKPADIRGFIMDGLSQYQSHYVNISMGKVQGTQLSSGVDTASQNIYAFLKVLANGPLVKLYQYTDQVKPRYFIQEEGQEQPVELKLYVFLNSRYETSIITRELYKGQLILLAKKYTPDNSNLLKRIAITEYQATQITEVINVINNNTGIKKISEGPAFRLFVGAGVGISKSKFTGDNEFATANSSKATNPVFSAGVDFLAKPHSQRFVLRAEVLYWYTDNAFEADHVAGVDKYTASIKQHTFTILPQAIYNFYNSQNIKVYVGSGVGINFSTYKTIKTVTVDAYTVSYDNSIRFDPTWINIPVEVGLVLNKRIEFSARYLLPAEYSGGKYNVNINQLQFGAHLLFGKKR